MENECKKTIETWFVREGGGSLVLPNGWFGRPFDNEHHLTSFTQSNDSCKMILDNRHTLKFNGLLEVSDEGKELVITGFDTCDFIWKDYGSNPHLHRQTFSDGAIKLMAVPGR